MASRRPGVHNFGWSGSTGSKEPRVATEIRRTIKTGIKFPEKETEPSPRSIRALPQPSVSSRLPQPSSHRRLTDSKSEEPRLVQRHQSQDSAGSSRSLSSKSPSGPSSSIPSSTKLSTSALKTRKVLRRKRSGLSQDTASSQAHAHNDSTGTISSASQPRSQTPLDLSTTVQIDRDLAQSPTEIRVAQQVEISKSQAVTIYPELDRYRDVSTQNRAETPGSNVPPRITTDDLPPPTPLFSGNSSQSAFSGSPSTRWSESPGPGPYSRDTTPTSFSSHSPGLVAPIRIAPSGSLSRPPVTRRRAGSLSNEVVSPGPDPQGLPAVKELPSSASSNSTVRATEKDSSMRKINTLPVPNSDESREVGSPSNTSLKPSHHQITSAPLGRTNSVARSRLPKATQPAASARPTPPPRPSRDGTPDLQGQLELPIPIIHSNLSVTSIPERRESGQLIPTSSSRSGSVSAPSDRTTHSRTSSKEAGLPTLTTGEGVRIPSRQGSSGPTRTPSPAISTFKSRFGLFGRRAKTAPEPAPQVRKEDKKDRPPRKGPAAGTGHEGYGRIGSVRRKTSLSHASRAIPGTMSSQDSSSSNQSLDKFLKERMAPVIIAGGEVIENRNLSMELSRTESNRSSVFRRPSVESRNSSQVSLASREVPKRTLWPSPFPRNPGQSSSLSARRPSESSESDFPGKKPTIALRRSIQRLKSGKQDSPKIPKPIITTTPVMSPPLTSLDASILSNDSLAEPSMIPNAVSSASTDLSAPKKLTKKARTPRCWNLFGRSQAEKDEFAPKTVTATVKVVPSKPVAFYTILDGSEQDDNESLDVEEVLREAKVIPDTLGQNGSRRPPVVQNSTTAASPSTAQPVFEPATRVGRAATVPETIPNQRLASTSQADPLPASEQQPTSTDTTKVTSRPSRLPQIGRIPKVGSTKTTLTSPKSSSSRQNTRLSTLKTSPKPVTQDDDSKGKEPSVPSQTMTHPDDDGRVFKDPSNISALIHCIPRYSPPIPRQPAQEFLSFSPPQDSTTTTASSDSSCAFPNYANAIGIVPESHAPLTEDEIWDEYNDLLGEDTIQFSAMEGPSVPKPLRLERDKAKEIEPSLESPTLSPPPLGSLVEVLRSSSVRGSDVLQQATRGLNGERISALPTSIPESGNLATTDDSNPEAEPNQEIISLEKQVRLSDASGSSQGSDDSSPLAQVNLRVGSMTVSKWLTFGHVLFSPVRDELIPVSGSLNRPSILVIDGLGNDDWSFYAAETYPAATFFNLSPRAPLPAEYRTESSFPLTPPNHHQVQYLSYRDKFPFGANSFTAVVFRFPAAAPESHYRNIISEARRVLQPGGYIELSILDVDLNQMGNRCRRAVRRLKERIHITSPDISLAPASDLILRLMGRRGFIDIKSCRVGVPVASSIAKSLSGTNSSDPNKSVEEKKKYKDKRSLPEMMDDESPVADESIAKSVAKVGRWWYTRCYESAAGVGIDGDDNEQPSYRSMWSDKALLAECEQWGTSLKLMVCHARVPEGPARVASI